MLNRCTLGGLLFFCTLACKPSVESTADPELETRLQETEQRLASIETKLDAVIADIEPLIEWAVVAKANEEERSTRRKELEARRDEREERRDEERGRLASSEVEGGVSSRVIDGAAEGIHCSGAETSKIECRFDRALLDELLADPSIVSKQARVVPSMRDGKTEGFKLYGVRPGSVPKLLGFKNGDLVESVNGEVLNSVDQALSLYTKFRDTTTLKLGLVRKGAPLTMTIEFEE